MSRRVHVAVTTLRGLVEVDGDCFGLHQDGALEVGRTVPTSTTPPQAVAIFAAGTWTDAVCLPALAVEPELADDDEPSWPLR